MFDAEVVTDPFHEIAVSPAGVASLDLRVQGVSPIGGAFFSQAGLEVIASELKWIWLPCAVLTVLTIGMTRAIQANRSSP